MQNQQKLMYVFESGPYSTAKGAEALDALLIGASFDQEVSVLFLFDGVFQLKIGQESSTSGLKQYTRAFKALADFDVTNVYAHDQSLFARGLKLDDLMLDCQIVDSVRISQLISQQDKVFTF